MNVKRRGNNNWNILSDEYIIIINNAILTLRNLFSHNIYRFYTKLRSLNKKLLQHIVTKVASDNLPFSDVLESYFNNTFGNKANGSEYQG